MEASKINSNDIPSTTKSNFEDQLLLVSSSLSKILTSKNNSAIINKINKQQVEVIKKGVIDSESHKSFISLYEKATRQNDRQLQRIRNTLESIYEIQNARHRRIKSHLQLKKCSIIKFLQEAATTMPVWFPTNDEQPPPLCGAVEPHSSYVAKSGDLIAALVKQSGEERWIVAEAVAFKNGKYDVEDIDEKETYRTFTLEKKYVKPLPLMKADPITCPNAIFPCNTFVLALYPQTTCFFKALVKAPPKTSRDEYEVLFKDDFDQHTVMMSVSQRFVVSLPSLETTDQDIETLEEY